MNFSQPKNVKQIRQFLGLTGWVRKFIPNYGIIAKPLYERLKKNSSFVWGSEEEVAFTSLKQKLCEYPVLRSLDFEKPLRV